jgi:tRNA(Ile)-lysidine synthase
MTHIFPLLEETIASFCQKIVEQKKIAVAVSGGSDSMALCLLINEWAKQNQCAVVALTVDHNLRKNSFEEAKTVQTWMENKNIEHHILTWEHGPINTGIQKKAREARYEILTNFCNQNNIQTICTAHHAADQLETFLMRLSKGSGLEGLSVMKECSTWNNVTIARPLLLVQPDILKQYLQAISQDYIKDPSNNNLKFERVQWRTFLKNMKEQGLLMEQFPQSLERLQSVNNFINETIEDVWDDVVSLSADCATLAIVPLLQLHECIATKIIARTLQHVSNKTYAAAYENMLDIFQQLQENRFKKLSAGGCVIEQQKAQLIILKDERLKNAAA